MFNELENLIKPDPETLDKFENLKSEFLSNKRDDDKKLLNRSKIVAVVLGMASVISILFLVYAFIIKQKSDEKLMQMNTTIDELNFKLEECRNN